MTTLTELKNMPHGDVHILYCEMMNDALFEKEQSEQLSKEVSKTNQPYAKDQLKQGYEDIDFSAIEDFIDT